MFKSDYEAIKGGNNIWTTLLVPTAKPYSWDPSSSYIHDSPFLKNRKGRKSSGYVEYEITPHVDHYYFEPCGVLGSCWQLVEAEEYFTRLLLEPTTTTTWKVLMDGSCIHEVIDIVDQVEIRTFIFDNYSQSPMLLFVKFLPGGVKEVLKEGVLYYIPVP